MWTEKRARSQKLGVSTKTTQPAQGRDGKSTPENEAACQNETIRSGNKMERTYQTQFLTPQAIRPQESPKKMEGGPQQCP